MFVFFAKCLRFQSSPPQESPESQRKVLNKITFSFPHTSKDLKRDCQRKNLQGLQLEEQKTTTAGCAWTKGHGTSQCKCASNHSQLGAAEALLEGRGGCSLSNSAAHRCHQVESGAWSTLSTS